MRMSPITPASPYMVPTRQKVPSVGITRHRFVFVTSQPSLVRRILNWLDKPFSWTDWS